MLDKKTKREKYQSDDENRDLQKTTGHWENRQKVTKKEKRKEKG